MRHEERRRRQGSPEAEWQKKCVKKRYGSGQFRRVHVHLPLHLLYAFGNHGPAPPLHRNDRRTPGSASHGDEWIDHARTVTAGASAARSRGRVQRRLLRPARPLRSGARGTAVHPAARSTSGTWTTASTTSVSSSPNSSPTRCGTRLPADAARARSEPGPARAAAPDALDLAAGVRGARPQPRQPGRRASPRTSRRSRGAGCSWSTRSPTAGAGTRSPARCDGKVVWALFRLQHAGRRTAASAFRRRDLRVRIDAPRGWVDRLRAGAVHAGRGWVDPPAIRWSNSPSLMPRSIASISARV